MGAGPFAPRSLSPGTAGNAFASRSGATIKYTTPSFIASLGANSYWTAVWDLPNDAIPSGTLKLLLRWRTLATSGVAQIQPAWNVFGDAADVDGGTYAAESGATTLTATGTAWRLNETKITLAAVTVSTPAQALIMKLQGITSGWTLAQILCLVPLLLWE